MKVFYRYILIGFILLLGLTSCVGSKSTAVYTKTELFFGLSAKNGEITQAQWLSYKTHTLNKLFEGYTEVDATGFWTNAVNETQSEGSKLIIYLNKNTRKDRANIKKAIAEYKRLFDQESVLIVNTRVRAKF